MTHSSQRSTDTTTFTRHTEQTAPQNSRAVLAKASSDEGIPHLLAFMAESPALLNGYAELYRRFAQTSLTPAERQLVLLTASVENECHYCVAGHTPVAHQAGISAADVAAVRDGRSLSNPRYEALRLFTQALVISRAFVDNATVQAFISAGYSSANVLDVVLGIAVKTMSNYTNHLVDTPLDASSIPHDWTPPSIREAA